MNPYAEAINRHYGQEDLEPMMLEALKQAGKNIDALTREDLSLFDEFHVRGLEATRELAQLAGLNAGMDLLDLGCGVGGPARTLAAEFGCTVVGIDLTEAYCRAATFLTERVGLSDRVRFRHGDMQDMPFEDDAFDVVWSQHVLMNIEDKPRLFREIRRVLRPGGRFVLYTICQGSVHPLHYPVPWAGDDSLSFLLPPDALRSMLHEAGFTDRLWRDVSDVSVTWFRKRIAARQLMAALRPQPENAPPALGMGLVMGGAMAEKISNVARNIEENRIRIIQGILHPEP